MSQPGEVSCPAKPRPNFRFTGKMNDWWLKPLSFGVVRYATPDNQNVGIITNCTRGRRKSRLREWGVAWPGPQDPDPEPFTTTLSSSYFDQPDRKPKLRHGVSLTQDPTASNRERGCKITKSDSSPGSLTPPDALIVVCLSPQPDPELPASFPLVSRASAGA